MALNGLGLVTIRVTPEELNSQAANVSGKIASAKKSFSEISGTIERTSSYWVGEAGDNYRAFFEKFEPDMKKIFKRFAEHAKDLEDIAAVYTGAESKATAAAEPLLGNVII